MNISYYDVNGIFLSTGTATIQREGAPFIEVLPPNAIGSIPYEVDIFNQYADLADGIVKDIPDKPSAAHILDVVTKAWFDPRTLEDLKSVKWQEIRKARDMAEVSVFPYMSKMIQGNELSVLRIERAALRAREALALGEAFSIEWRTADNTILTLDALGMIGMPLALAAHSAAIDQQAMAYKVLINSIETDTPAAVNAIVWQAL